MFNHRSLLRVIAFFRILLKFWGVRLLIGFVKSGWKTISVDHVYSEEATGSIEIPQGKFLFYNKYYACGTAYEL